MHRISVSQGSDGPPDLLGAVIDRFFDTPGMWVFLALAVPLIILRIWGYTARRRW